MKIYDRIFPPARVTLSDGAAVLRPRSRAPLILAVLAAMIALSVRITGVNFYTLAERGNEFFVILGQMVPHKLDYMQSVWQPLFDTIKMSLLGSIAGCTAAMPFAILASSNIVKNKVFIGAIRLLIAVIRTLPTLVIALLATFIFGLGTFAGTLAIAVFTFGIVVKMLYEKFETVDMGAFEAAEALGATKLRAFLSAILPQILPFYLSTSLYCFEITVRYAAILGYVGAGGIGLILSEKIGYRQYSRVGMILIMLYVTVVIIESVSKYLRSKLQ